MFSFKRKKKTVSFINLSQEDIMDIQAWHMRQLCASLEKMKDIPWHCTSKDGVVHFYDTPSKVHITGSKKISS